MTGMASPPAYSPLAELVEPFSDEQGLFTCGVCETWLLVPVYHQAVQSQWEDTHYIPVAIPVGPPPVFFPVGEPHKGQAINASLGCCAPGHAEPSTFPTRAAKRGTGAAISCDWPFDSLSGVRRIRAHHGHLPLFLRSPQLQPLFFFQNEGLFCCQDDCTEVREERGGVRRATFSVGKPCFALVFLLVLCRVTSTQNTRQC